MAEKKKEDACTKKVKRRYKVWPSAYASGAVVQCRRGKIWKGLKEDAADEQLFENTEYEQFEAFQQDENLKKWFSRQGAPGKKGGWVDCNAPKYKKGKKVGYKSCGRAEGEKRSKYPACRPTAAACKKRSKSWGKKARKGKKG